MSCENDGRVDATCGSCCYSDSSPLLWTPTSPTDTVGLGSSGESAARDQLNVHGVGWGVWGGHERGRVITQFAQLLPREKFIHFPITRANKSDATFVSARDPSASVLTQRAALHS